jgi:23S rRNA pseudouridine1911/1915/1917 synthase
LNAEIISTEAADPACEVAAEDDLESEVRKVVVPAHWHGLRLDKCLAQSIPEFSRAYLQQLVVQGDVTDSNGVLFKSSAKVHAGAHISVNLRPSLQAQSFKAEAVALDVVYEDEHLMVINKSAGVVVHPAAGNWTGTILNGLLMHHAGAADLPRAGIVHRLDKDTSGLMMVGKTRVAVDSLTRQIASRSVNRYYLALAERAWKRSSTLETVDQPVGRDPVNRIRRAVLRREHGGGKPAKTMIKLLDDGAQVCLVACKLFTGRTHQIRVHLSWLGHPIVGDVVYGGHTTDIMIRQALHATRLDFVHPVSADPLSFTADLPSDMQQALTQSGLHYNQGSIGPSLFGSLSG